MAAAPIPETIPSETANPAQLDSADTEHSSTDINAAAATNAADGPATPHTAETALGSAPEEKEEDKEPDALAPASDDVLDELAAEKLAETPIDV